MHNCAEIDENAKKWYSRQEVGKEVMWAVGFKCIVNIGQSVCDNSAVVSALSDKKVLCPLGQSSFSLRFTSSLSEERESFYVKNVSFVNLIYLVTVYE